MTQASTNRSDFDAIVVGAGLAGLHQLHRLTGEGLEVVALEASDGVGGVWHHNRYPGARVDSHFPHYQYWFSAELWDEIDWLERFPSQPEIERYLNYVCDRFKLRERIRFNSCVVSADYDDSRAIWTVTTKAGQSLTARFLVLNSGGLSAPRAVPITGAESFGGVSCHTSHWPKAGIDLVGKRVGVIGTAATGIQVIQTIAPSVSHLTVFQRTPNFAVPMKNPAITEAERQQARADFERLRGVVHQSFGGFAYDNVPPMFDEVTDEQRLERLEGLWLQGTLEIWGGAFADTFANPAASAFVTKFVRGKIAPRIKDPKLADRLLPTDHDFGTRRVPLENGYYETFNRDNVALVDLREEPILSIDQTGINTASGHIDLDVIIYATGFEAGVGAINRIAITGRDGLVLKDEWEKALRTTVGMQVHGFPNLFMTMAPFAPASALCNLPVCADQQVDWIGDTIRFMVNQGAKSIEPSLETETAWMDHHNEVSEPTMLGTNKNSWYRHKRKDGTVGELIAYVGGIPQYRATCDAMIASGFEGFVIR